MLANDSRDPGYLAGMLRMSQQPDYQVRDRLKNKLSTSLANPVLLHLVEARWPKLVKAVLPHLMKARWPKLDKAEVPIEILEWYRLEPRKPTPMSDRNERTTTQLSI